MNFLSRVVPTRAALVEDHEGKLSSEELAGTDMMLNLLATADMLREAIFEKYQKDYGLSEGNITMMMILNHHKSMGILNLSAAMGVKPSTASVMVKRMLNNPDPFIELLPSESDGRVKNVSLTKRGSKVIKNELLPGLNTDLTQVASALSIHEQEQMVRLLKKLLNQ